MKECPKCHDKTLFFGQPSATYQQAWNCLSCGFYHDPHGFPHSTLRQLGKPYAHLYLNKPDRTVAE